MEHLPDLATCKKLGFIVPSSNTAVEPICTAIVQSLHANIICLFTRIQVKTVGTDDKTTSQFSTEIMIQAAHLLADAEADVIMWNGTSGMWVGGGLQDDKQLAQAMSEATGIPCSTTTIATIEALEHLALRNISIAVPYTEALTAKLGEFYVRCGYDVVGTARLEATPASNLEIAKSSEVEIREVIQRSASPATQAIIVACTNWPASALVPELEAKLNVTIIDSIIVTMWWALRLIGRTRRPVGWGKLMSEA